MQSVITRGYERCIPKERTANTSLGCGLACVVNSDGTIDAGDPGAAGVLRISYNRGAANMEKADTYDAGELAMYVTPPKGVEVEVQVDDDTYNDGVQLVVDDAAADGTFRQLDEAGGDTTDMVVGEVVGDGDVAGRLIMEVQ